MLCGVNVWDRRQSSCTTVTTYITCPSTCCWYQVGPPVSQRPSVSAKPRTTREHFHYLCFTNLLVVISEYFMTEDLLNSDMQKYYKGIRNKLTQWLWSGNMFETSITNTCGYKWFIFWIMSSDVITTSTARPYQMNQYDA